MIAYDIRRCAEQACALKAQAEAHSEDELLTRIKRAHHKQLSDKLIAALEARRAAALREIGFHRADFADRLAAATQPAPIEDAEFAEVTSPGEGG